ncbi:riboflavin synthase subunit beta [Alphaproteobacteria bacterium KMM 3653]|uniref:Riboflavin synthase subunit beta n=1 Tax=Harenicola maris TaxID=2841044 RepID=A0AAP2CTJ3_9RHOB|nr:riboflavin synthase subunit beta [Harenicola maris]
MGRGFKWHIRKAVTIVQVLGICRFSYPCYGGFRREHATIEDRINFLYGAERLEERFRYFETFTLPGLRYQTDEDFTFLVLTGNQMPKPYRERLHDMLATLPQARLLEYEPMNHREAVKKAIQEHITIEQGAVAQFRLDDDDGVSYRFVQRLREAWEDGRKIMQRENRFAVDFNQGYKVCIRDGALCAAPVKAPYWTPALAIYLRPRAPRTVIHFRHDIVHTQMTTLTYTGEDMFVRGINATNGTPFTKAFKEEMVPLDTETRKALSKSFGIDEDVLEKFRQSEAGARAS